MPPGPEETFIFQKQRCELERGQAFHGKEAISLAIFERWNGGMEEVVRARLTPDLPPSAIL